MALGSTRDPNKSLRDGVLHSGAALKLLASLEKQSKPFLLLMGVSLTTIIGLIDFLTGYEIAFSIFYGLPISLVTWLTSRRFGLLVSAVSAAVLLAADTASGHLYSHPLIPIWNTLIRFATFVVITVLVSALRNALKREREHARIDDLTGAVNRRYFYELLQMEIDRLERYEHAFTIAYIDVDNFKSINDRFGHAIGDRVLQNLASSVKKLTRRSDTFARIGGDEFALLLPETNQQAAHLILPKIQGEMIREMRQNNWPVTFSIGVLTCINPSHSAEELLQRADELMYLVKREHKNSIRYSLLEADFNPLQARGEI